MKERVKEIIEAVASRHPDISEKIVSDKELLESVLDSAECFLFDTVPEAIEAKYLKKPEPEWSPNRVYEKLHRERIRSMVMESNGDLPEDEIERITDMVISAEDQDIYDNIDFFINEWNK